MKLSDKNQFCGSIMTAVILLQFFENNKSISQFNKKLQPVCGSIKTYTKFGKFIVKNEPLLTNFALFHKYLFSKNDSFPNICNKFCFKILIFYRNEETLSGFFWAFSSFPSC